MGGILIVIMELVMYAIIEASGVQHRVSEGDVLELDRLGAEVDTTITFDKVLFVARASNFVN